MVLKNTAIGKVKQERHTSLIMGRGEKSHWTIVTPVSHRPLMAKADHSNPRNGTNLTGTCPLAGAFCDVCLQLKQHPPIRAEINYFCYLYWKHELICRGYR